ncbi:MAG: hypothetical protein H6R07_522 [Proteobacteria bacterium]|nr:hypothetical protein [Pseudomonadota bacterium]
MPAKLAQTTSTKPAATKPATPRKRSTTARKPAPCTDPPHSRRTAKSSPKTESSTVTPSAGTKQSRLIALIQQPMGATLDELMTATGWQAHSVRGIISGTLRKKLGFKVALTANSDGVRAYRIDA